MKKKLINLEKKIQKFDSLQLEHVRESSSKDRKKYASKIKRAQRALGFIEEKFADLATQFSAQEMASIKASLDEKTIELNKHVTQCNERDVCGDMEGEANPSETKPIDKKIKKLIDKFERSVQDYDSRVLERVTDYDQDTNLKMRASNIKRAVSKLKDLHEDLHLIKDKYPAYSNQEIEETLNIYEEKITKEKTNYDNDIEFETHLEKSSKMFHDLSSFFAYSSLTPQLFHALSKAFIHDYESYTLEDTETILNTDTTKFRLNTIKNRFQSSLDNLNNPSHTTEFFDNLDKFLASTDNKLLPLQNLYASISFIQDVMYPDHDAITEILYYIDKLLDKENEQRSEEIEKIVVSDFHRDHVNQVFFTNNTEKPIAELTANDMKETFRLGEPIRCIVFLDDLFENKFQERNRPKISIEKEAFLNVPIEEFNKDSLNKSYYDFMLVRNDESYHKPPTVKYSSAGKVMSFLSDMPMREKSYTFSIDNEWAMGKKWKGTIKINGDDPEGLDTLKYYLSKLKEGEVQSTKLPEPGMQNPEIEKEILALFNSFDWSHEFHKVIITSKKYKAVKNIFDVAVARSLYVALTFTLKNKCYYRNYIVVQEPVGDGWSSFWLDGKLERFEISCNNVK